MSHVVAIDLEVKDLDALAKACKNLGLELALGQKTYRWYGRSVGDYPLPAGFTASELGRCEHAIKIPGNQSAYEIGVVKRKDGRPGYTLLWDFWSRGFGMQDKAGDNCGLLRQGYTTQVSKKHLISKGYKVSEVKKADGTIVIKAVR